MTEKHAYPKCKICGGWHRGVEHEFGTKSTAAKADEGVNRPDVRGSSVVEQRGASRGGPSLSRSGSIPLPPVDTNSDDAAPGRRQKAEGADAPKPSTAAPSATLSEIGALADAASARIAAKPKGKRGRPANGFDKKAHDRQKAAERRAKAKETAE